MNQTRNQWNVAGSVAFSALTLFALFAVALSAITYAKQESQKQSADNSVVDSGRVGTVSGSKVRLKLTFDNGAVFKVTQFEGAPIRVTRNGSTVVIATHLDSENLNRVHAKIYKVFPVGVQLGEGMAEVGSLDIGKTASEFNEGDLACKIEVVQIVVDMKTTEDRNEFSRVHLMGGGTGQCCLTCDGITVCGCGVDGSCGSCCVGSCCILYG